MVTPTSARAARIWERGRVALASAVVAGLVVAQAPGRIVADTKLDLVVDPVGLLGRALHLWEPLGYFGHVPNQAAGYLFPMGPFFALGDIASAPPWLVQRAWVGLLLVAALVGMVRLARALRIGTENTRILGGLAYALSPGVSALAGTSAALLPVVLLPWVLVPLVEGTRRGSPRRAAARSGLAVAAMGGVNAATIVAVLPVPALFLATRGGGRRRRRLVGWWIVALVLATSWWVGALVIQGRYGFNFLPFTESAAVTTGSVAATEVLRGAGGWLAYLHVSGPWVVGAWVTAALPAAVAAGAVLAAAGLYGLGRRDCPERRFLVITLLGGVAVGMAGYAGALGGPFAGAVRDLLDGPLAPLRNVAKFFPLVRIPLVLGLVHAVTVVRIPRVERRVVGAVMVAAVVAAAAPFVRGQLFPGGSFEALPEHWEEASAWLDAREAGGRSLLVPGAPFGEYTWGRPLDEPLQAIGDVRWAARNLIPLDSGESTRALDAVEAEFDARSGSEHLARALGDSGVEFLVVRNDLDWRRAGAPRPLQMRQVLADSPGLRRVARFGPPVAELQRAGVADEVFGELESGLRAVEIYRVEGAGRIDVYPVSETALVVGGPEAAVNLSDDSIVEGGAVVLDGQALPGAVRSELRGVVVTDVDQRRDADFGLVFDRLTHALGPTEASPHTGRQPARFPGGSGNTVLIREGAARVTASSYGAPIARFPQFAPHQAFDGDPDTIWTTGALGEAGEWLQIDLGGARTVDQLTLRPLADGPWRPVVREVEVRTEAGATRADLAGDERPVEIAVPSGSTRWVRVTLTDVEPAADPTAAAGAGLREVVVPGVSHARIIGVRAPSVPELPLSYVFTSPADQDSRFLGEARDEEPVMRRRFALGEDRAFAVRGVAVARPGPERDRMLAEVEVTASATSTWTGAGPAGAVVDADPATAWLADPADDDPSVHLEWEERIAVDELVVVGAPAPAVAPDALTISSTDGVREVEVPPGGGVVEFEPLVTSSLTIGLPGPRRVAGPEDGGDTLLPVGLAEVRIRDVDTLVEAGLERPFTLDCGSGPTLSLDGGRVATALSGRLDDIARYRPLGFSACGRGGRGDTIRLDPGVHDLSERAGGGLWKITQVVLDGSPAGPPAPVPARRARVSNWADVERRIEIAAGPASILVVHETYNDGWEASYDGRSLEAVRIRGWQQGFVVPAGARGVIDLTFTPDAPYRLGLLAGGALALLLIPLAWVPSRRSSRPGTAAGPTRRRAAVPVAVGAAALAVVAGPLALLVPAFAWRRIRPWLPWTAAVCMGVAGLIATASAGAGPGSGEGAFGPWAQLFAVASLAAVVATFAPSVAASPRSVRGEGRGAPVSARRDPGQSPHISGADESGRGSAKPDTTPATRA